MQPRPENGTSFDLPNESNVNNLRECNIYRYVPALQHRPENAISWNHVEESNVIRVREYNTL